jgi:hypothetical protein
MMAMTNQQPTNQHTRTRKTETKKPGMGIGMLRGPWIWAIDHHAGPYALCIVLVFSVNVQQETEQK